MCSQGMVDQACNRSISELSLLNFPLILGGSIGLLVFCSSCIIIELICLSIQTVRMCKRRYNKRSKSIPQLSITTQSSIRIPMALPPVDLEFGVFDIHLLGMSELERRRSHLVRNQYYTSNESMHNAGINTETIAYIDPEILSVSPNRRYSILLSDSHPASTSEAHCIANLNARDNVDLEMGLYQSDSEDILPKPTLPPKPKVRFEDSGKKLKRRMSSSFNQDDYIIYETIGEDDKEMDNLYSRLSRPIKNERRCVVLSQEERNSLPRQKNSYTFPGILKQKRQTRYFKEAPIYDKPSNTLDKLFDQMSAMNFREIVPDTLVISEHLGSGEFGIVCKGVWISRLGEVPIAVKTLKEPTSEERKIALFQEAIIMGQFSHQNIIRILGIVSVIEPYAIVSELMKMEMLEFLQTVRNSKIDLNKLPPLLLRFCREIADGMEYLASKRFVHRDLAARNILIANNYTIRIADFGMAREILDTTAYYSQSGGNIPVRWTSPEALFHQKYSEKSDVWAFGMTMFEIWSLGLNPWYKLSNEEVIRAVHSQITHPPPTGCPRDVYLIIVETLKYDATKRGTFAQIKDMLENPIVLSRPTTGTNADVLGNDPDLAKDLYLDLQAMYVS